MQKLQRCSLSVRMELRLEIVTASNKGTQQAEKTELPEEDPISISANLFQAYVHSHDAGRAAKLSYNTRSNQRLVSELGCWPRIVLDWPFRYDI